MKKESLDKLVSEKDLYDVASRDIIDNLSFRKADIGIILEMKSTEGWKKVEKKLRETLQERINILIKDDPSIKALLTLLNIADTKSMSSSLEEEIRQILHE